MLLAKSGATELERVSSFFMYNLLVHLKFGGIKPFKIDFMGRMLGENTVSEEIKDSREGNDICGAYFAFDEEDTAKEMTDLILVPSGGSTGEVNFDTPSRGKSIRDTDAGIAD